MLLSLFQQLGQLKHGFMSKRAVCLRVSQVGVLLAVLLTSQPLLLLVKSSLHIWAGHLLLTAQAGCHHILNWQVQHWWLVKRGGCCIPFCAPTRLAHPLLQCP